MENVKMPVSLHQTVYGSTAFSVSPTSSPKAERYFRKGDKSPEVNLKKKQTSITDTISINSKNSQRDLIHTQIRSPSFLHLSGSNRNSRMTLDTKPNSEAVQIMQRIEFVLNIINQMCIGFVTIYLSWLCFHTGLKKTSLHAWLVTIGFHFLMTEAIMCHYNANALTEHYRRNTKTTIHWTLQVLGGGLGIAGVLIKCIDRGFLLQTTHGKLGFAAFILTAISMFTGLAALFSTRVKKIVTPVLNKSFHNLLGISSFVIALVAQYYGYQSGFFSRKVSNDFKIFMQVITLLILVLSSIGPLQALYHKLRIIRKHFS